MVVADTSPLNYLILIRAEELLVQLYGEVWIPPAVQAELFHRNAPTLVRSFMASPPPWLFVREPSTTDPLLAHLDVGEAAAILLAEQLKAPVLLIDERAGVQAARDRGLHVTGTLGVLDEAARRGLIDLQVALEGLRQTTFRMSDRLARLLLDAQHEREA